MTEPFTLALVHEKMHKIRWLQDHARRGYERNRMSPELAEALRLEIRNALDAGGGPFDVNVARRVYDLAIAARDMCIAASGTVKEAIDQIKETNGPMETLDSPGTPESQLQVSETFGARIMRELLAMLPAFRKIHEHEDPHVLIAAIADARDRGMHDLAAKLEQRLVGTPFEQPKITQAEVVANSYEHGFIHGSMQDNFDNGTINGVAGIDRQHWSPAYREGYEAARARRLSTVLPSSSTDSTPSYDFGSQYRGALAEIERGRAEIDREASPPIAAPITADEKSRGGAWSYPEGGLVDQTRCVRCGHWKGDHYPSCARSTRRSKEQAWAQCACPEFVACEHPSEALGEAPYDDGYQVFCRTCGKHVRLGRLPPFGDANDGQQGARS